MSTANGDYVYKWWEEHGRDPFAAWVPNEEDRRELESKINIAINLAINRPADPLAPNIPLLNFARELEERFPNATYIFYRVAGIPNPLHLETMRNSQVSAIKKSERYNEIYNRMLSDERAKYESDMKEKRRASHKGGWSYHDLDCQCGRYFDPAGCNRGGYIWSCCNSTIESSACSEGPPIEDPIQLLVDAEFNDDEMSAF